MARQPQRRRLPYRRRTPRSRSQRVHDNLSGMHGLRHLCQQTTLRGREKLARSDKRRHLGALPHCASRSCATSPAAGRVAAAFQRLLSHTKSRGQLDFLSIALAHSAKQRASSIYFFGISGRRTWAQRRARRPSRTTHWNTAHAGRFRRRLYSRVAALGPVPPQFPADGRLCSIVHISEDD